MRPHRVTLPSALEGRVGRSWGSGGGGFRGNGIHGLHLLNPHGDKRLAQQKYRLLERRGATMEIISVHEKQFGQRQPSSRQHVGPTGASGGPQ